ncbi:MBL fold metallo-hydrolase [Mesorhizobium sp. CAU 1732]|uniref:MBL fold metallo-hydrolase n=1 Tax=Mesorhizobium sp. CAU 1732 TaxID=3140358 RepID=UPI00326058D0
MLNRPTQANAAEPARLSFPFAEPPKTGEVTEVAPGILWTRIPLPFRLDHVNIFLIEDGDGWAVLDTGIADQPTRDVWEALVAGPLAGRRLTRLIVTHFHPDHIGLAGWLCQRFELPLLTSQTCYLGCINISLRPEALEAKPYLDFYLQHGMDPSTAALVATQGHNYLRMVAPLPPTFHRLVAGDTLTIGGRAFDVMAGDGHAPEQLMLYLREENIFLAADQVLAKITPNVSVWAVDPEGNPLGLYLRSLRAIPQAVPADAFVLPGHQLPFHGLHTRCAELIAHHEERCALIADACRQEPKSVADLVPVLFHRTLDAHQMSFAFSEVHAHVNKMLHAGELRWADSSDGRMRARTV